MVDAEASEGGVNKGDELMDRKCVVIGESGGIHGHESVSFRDV